MMLSLNPPQTDASLRNDSFSSLFLLLEDFYPNQLQQITLAALMAGCQCIQKLTLCALFSRSWVLHGKISHQLAADRPLNPGSRSSPEKRYQKALASGLCNSKKDFCTVCRKWSSHACRELLLCVVSLSHHPPPLQDSHSAASVQPKYSFAPSSALNKMAKPFTAGGAGTSSGPPIKPVAYSPKLNTPSSTQGQGSMQPPHNG